MVADSNYFIALFSPLDSLFGQAVKLSKIIAQTGTSLVLSNYIFLETVTVLSQRTNRAAAISVGNHLLRDQVFQIVHIGDSLHTESWNIFQSMNKKNMSFVDCSTLALLNYTGIKSLLTFDTTDFEPLAKKYNFKLFG